MDNKQIIHIATEVITIVGLTIYFSKQTKKLFESIETLTTSLNEQNEVIQKHENMINKLLETVQQLAMQQQSSRQFQPQQPVLHPQQVPVLHPQQVPHQQQQPVLHPQQVPHQQQQPVLHPQQVPHQQPVQIKPQAPKVLQPQQNKEPINMMQETLEPQSQHIQFQFMQRPMSSEFKNNNKVEEILDSEDEEDEKIVEEELLDDELADELKELDE